MNTPLLVLELRRRRDLVLVRQRSRQITRLLGFDPLEQARVCAAVFEVAWQAFHKARPVRLVFQLNETTLQVFPTGVVPAGGGLPRLERLLPRKELGMTREDVAWAVQELVRLTPANLFEEVWQQNQELLRAFRELHVCRNELDHFKRPRPGAA
jgi:hypothetical protein